MNFLKRKLSLKVQIPLNRYEEPRGDLNHNCSHIIDNLYISGYKEANDYLFLKTNNFTHIVNCAGGSKSFLPLYFPDFTYLTIDLRDHSNSNIIEPIKKFMKFIGSIGNENKKILLHCTEGVSRAPAIMTSYLMVKMNMDLPSAINFVKNKRDCVDINLGFIFQLEKMNIELLKRQIESIL